MLQYELSICSSYVVVLVHASPCILYNRIQMKLLSFTLLVCGLAVRTSRKRRLAESSEEEPLDVPASRNSAGSSSRIETLSDDATPYARDEFTIDLKHRWAKGTLSSVDVQSLANKARKQGARNLEKLSAAGTYGVFYFVSIFHVFQTSGNGSACVAIC